MDRTVLHCNNSVILRSISSEAQEFTSLRNKKYYLLLYQNWEYINSLRMFWHRKIESLWNREFVKFPTMSWTPQNDRDLKTIRFSFKVHVFWEGHIILRNIHLRFVLSSNGQIYSGDFAKFCGLLRIYELYKWTNSHLKSKW